MPIGFPSRPSRKGSGCKQVIVDLQELVSSTETESYPISCRIVQDSGNGSAQKPDPHGTHTLVLHGVTECAALSLRRPGAHVSSPVGSPNSTGGRAVPVATVCLADTNTLFEMFAQNNVTTTDGSDSRSSDATEKSGYAYDGRLYCTLRSFLSTVKEHGRAYRIRGECQTGSPPRGAQQYEDYIIFPPEVVVQASPNDASPPNALVGGSSPTLPKPPCTSELILGWRLSCAAGRTYLQPVKISLDEERKWKICQNVQYLTARELSVALAANSSCDKQPSVFIRAVPVRKLETVSLLENKSPKDEQMQLLPLDAFQSTAKIFILASHEGECCLLSRDIHMSVAPIAEAADGSVLGATHKMSSCALAKLVLTSLAFLHGLCKINVYDQSIETQLMQARGRVLSHIGMLCSNSSVVNMNVLVMSSSEFYPSIFGTPPATRKSTASSTSVDSQSSSVHHNADSPLVEKHGAVQRRSSEPTNHSDSGSIDPYSWVRRSNSMGGNSREACHQSHLQKEAAGNGQLLSVAEHVSDLPPPLPLRSSPQPPSCGGPSQASSGLPPPSTLSQSHDGNFHLPPALPMKKRKSNGPSPSDERAPSPLPRPLPPESGPCGRSAKLGRNPGGGEADLDDCTYVIPNCGGPVQPALPPRRTLNRSGNVPTTGYLSLHE